MNSHNEPLSRPVPALTVSRMDSSRPGPGAQNAIRRVGAAPSGEGDGMQALSPVASKLDSSAFTTLTPKQKSHSTSPFIDQPSTLANAISPDTTIHDSTSKPMDIIAEARSLTQKLLDEVDRDNPNWQANAVAYSRTPLKAFATSTTVTPEKFVQSGGLHSVVAAVRKHSNNSNIVDLGCKILGAFTIYKGTLLAEIATSGAIETVIGALNAQMDQRHPTSCVSALKMLRNQTQTEENRNVICKLGGIETIIKLMSSKQDDARCCSHAALVLSNLSFGNQKIKDDIGTLGGVEAIIKAIKYHGDVDVMQERGSLSLRNLCFHSERNQAIAGENGAVDVLLRAIREYPDNREIVHQSCVALSNMSTTNSTNRERILQAHGVSIVLKLMDRFKESATVNNDCIAILGKISAGYDSAQSEIGSSGGVEMIVAALKRLCSDSRVASHSATVLRYLCFRSENRERLVACGGIEAILEAMTVHKANAGVVEHSLLAIGNATFETPESKSAVGRCGGIEIILHAVEEHRRYETIQEHGCRVLRNLADGHELNGSLQIANGGINIAVLAMMGYPGSAAVQEQGLAMLLNLATNEAAVEKLVAADVGRIAEKACSSHANHRGVRVQADALLSMLGTRVEKSEPPMDGRVSKTESGSRLPFFQLGRRRSVR